MKLFYKILTPIIILSLILWVMPRTANAAISRIGAQTASGTGTVSVTATYGSTPTSGDLLIAVFLAVDGGSGATPDTIPSGWIQANSNGTSNSDNFMYYKVAGASEPTAVTFGDSTASSMIMAIYEYTGNLSASVLDQTTQNSCFSGSPCSTGTTGVLSQASELSIGVATFSGGGQTFSSWSNSYAQLSSVSGSLFTGELITSSTAAQSSTLTTTGSPVSAASFITTFKAAPTVTVNHGKVFINKSTVFVKSNVYIK